MCTYTLNPKESSVWNRIIPPLLDLVMGGAFDEEETVPEEGAPPPPVKRRLLLKGKYIY